MYYRPNQEKVLEAQRKRRRRDALSTAMLVIVVVLLFVGVYSCSYVVRNNSIEDCKKAGNTAIVPSWFSHDPWDVKCIEK